MEKRGKIVTHHLSKYKFTAVLLLITTYFSVVAFCKLCWVQTSLFGVSQSVLSIMQQSPRWCDHTVNTFWQHCQHDATALLIMQQCSRWCDDTVNMMQQRCKSCNRAVLDVPTLSTWCDSAVNHATVLSLMRWHCRFHLVWGNWSSPSCSEVWLRSVEIQVSLKLTLQPVIKGCFWIFIQLSTSSALLQREHQTTRREFSGAPSEKSVRVNFRAK